MGWKIRKSEGTTNGIYDVDYWFLSVEGLLFRSTKSVCDFMKESGSYSQEDVAKISKELESERTKIRQQKYDWLDGNPTVPPGWKVRVARQDHQDLLLVRGWKPVRLQTVGPAA